MSRCRFLALFLLLQETDWLRLSPSFVRRLTEQIYASTIPDSLKQAAARGLLLHLEKLQSEGKVERKKVEKVEGEPLEGWYDLWRLVDGSEGEEVAKGGAKF